MYLFWFRCGTSYRNIMMSVVNQFLKRLPVISTHVCLVNSVMLNPATLWTVARQAPL